MVLRLNGISSGMDIDGMVKQLMAARRVPVDKLYQSRQALQWQREGFRDMNTKLLDFRTNKLFNYRLEGTFSAKKAEVSGNTSAVSAKVTGDAQAGTINVDVNSLAKGTVQIGGDIRLYTGGVAATFNADNKLADEWAKLGQSGGMDSQATYTLMINGKTVTVDPKTQSLNNVLGDINLKTNVNAFYDSVRGKISFTTKDTGAAAVVDFTGTTDSAFVTNIFKAGTTISGDMRKNGMTIDPAQSLSSQAPNFSGSVPGAPFELVVNSRHISIDPAANTLNDIMGAVNAAGINVSASFDAASGKIQFTSLTSTGTAAMTKVDFTGTGSSVLSGLFKIDPTSNGTDANVTINGMTTTRASNTFSVNGVEITLNQTGSAAINVKTDADKIVDSVKGFIKDYNDMLKALEDKVDEPRYRNFAPLTDAQKKDMKDTDIQSWETKAKSGMLKNDEILSRAVNQMRMSITAQVETGDPNYKTLTTLGIQTGAYQEKGKLYLMDENKLRAAITASPNAVKALFTAKGNDDADRSDVGVAERMYDDLKVTLDQITQKAGYFSLEDSTSRDNSFIGKAMYDLNKQIDRGDTQLQKWEANYYRQFTAMETAMNKYNSQSTYLTNAFGGGK